MSETKQTYDTRFPRDRRLRAGDLERDAVADVLRREHVAGRLDRAEFEQRLGECLAAKTYADLDALIADFPQEEFDAPRARAFRRPGFPLFPLIPLVPIAVLAIALSHGHLVWLVFPLLFFFVVRPLVWGGWLGPRRFAYAGARGAAGCYRRR